MHCTLDAVSLHMHDRLQPIYVLCLEPKLLPRIHPMASHMSTSQFSSPQRTEINPLKLRLCLLFLYTYCNTGITQERGTQQEGDVDQPEDFVDKSINRVHDISINRRACK
jgi:hypothetical protein